MGAFRDMGEAGRVDQDSNSTRWNQKDGVMQTGGSAAACFGREAAWTGGLSRLLQGGFTGERHPELVVPGPRCGEK